MITGNSDSHPNASERSFSGTVSVCGLFKRRLKFVLFVGFAAVCLSIGGASPALDALRENTPLRHIIQVQNSSTERSSFASSSEPDGIWYAERKLYSWYVGQGWRWKQVNGRWEHDPQGIVDRNADVNCGPAVVSMVLAYADTYDIGSGWLLSLQKARELMGAGEGELTDSDQIIVALNALNIDHDAIKGESADEDIRSVENAIRLEHHVVILPINMGKISQSDIARINDDSPCASGDCVVYAGKKYRVTSFNKLKTGRYNTYEGPHWVVAVGIAVIDGKKYVIVKDPNTWESSNYYFEAGLRDPKGDDRLYAYDEVVRGLAAMPRSIAYPIEINNTPYSNPIPSDSQSILQEDGLDGSAIINAAQAQATYRLTLVSDSAPAQGTYIYPGTYVRKNWQVKNTGNTDFVMRYSIRQQSGPSLEHFGGSLIPSLLNGEQKEVTVLFRAPDTPGQYDTSWLITDDTGKVVSDSMHFRFVVHGSAPTVSTPTTVPNSCSYSPTTPGVLLYRERNYGGACSHVTSDVDNLSILGVGDNTVSSIHINGNYRVKLYEYTAYGGRREEVSSSDPNLDIRSLGEQFSSVRVNQVSGCTNTSSPGIYLYESKNFDGSCAHITTNQRDLGSTTVGDNDVSSVLVVGDYKLELFEDKEFKGRSDEISKNEANLDTRSLGNRYSSARVKEFVLCTNTSLDGVYLYSQENFGGNCSFLTSDAGDMNLLDVGDNEVKSIMFVGPVYAELYAEKNFLGAVDIVTQTLGSLSGLPLAGTYSSVKVLPRNIAPNAPFPIQPTGGNGDPPIYNLDQTFELCWESQGDFNGDALEFQVRASISAQEYMSEWLSGTCWSVSGQLPGTYSWSVRARDAELTSEWTDSPYAYRIGSFEYIGDFDLPDGEIKLDGDTVYLITSQDQDVVLEIYRFDDKQVLTKLSSYPIGQYGPVFGFMTSGLDFELVDNYVIMSTYYDNSQYDSLNHLKILTIDVADPIHPLLVAEYYPQITASFFRLDSVVHDHTLFLAADSGLLLGIDLREPEHLTTSFSITLPNDKCEWRKNEEDWSATQVARLDENSVWFGKRNCLYLVNLDNNSGSRVVASYDLSQLAELGPYTFLNGGMVQVGDTLMVSLNYGSVVWFNAFDPGNLALIGNYRPGCVYETGQDGKLLAIADDYVFIQSMGGICVYDVSSQDPNPISFGVFGTHISEDFPYWQNVMPWQVSFGSGVIYGANSIWSVPGDEGHPYWRLGVMVLRYSGPAEFPPANSYVGAVAQPGTVSSFGASVGVTLTLETQAGSVGTSTFLYADAKPNSPTPLSYHVVGNPFSLEGRTADGQVVTEFTAPLGITLTYVESQLDGLPESEVGLFYWNESITPSERSWVQIPATVNAEQNTVTASLDHFSLFMLAVNMEPVFADFTAQPQVGIAPLTVTFDSRAGGSVRRYEWTFGDGDTGDWVTTQHTFAVPGNYTVTHTVWSPAGYDAKTVDSYIVVQDAGQQNVPRVFLPIIVDR